MNTGTGYDATRELCEAVRTAVDARQAVYIQGGRSKLHLTGRHCKALPLPCTQHHGIVSYHPEEQVITARSGTRIEELVTACAEHNQCLGFEPAKFDGKATLGGTLACGLSGPARPWRGSIRDAVLGIRMINGRGEALRFGGEVMKNVAGYDVSRLHAGALGTLGLITEVSLRLLPKLRSRLCLRMPLPADEALRAMRELVGSSLPFTGVGWKANYLHLRFEGSAAALRETRTRLPAFEVTTAEHWESLKELHYPDFYAGNTGWIFDVAPATPCALDTEIFMIDWAGARRYSRHDLEVKSAQAFARSGGGHAQRYGYGTRSEPIQATPTQARQQLEKRLKSALDPASIFNPGRLHTWI